MSFFVLGLGPLRWEAMGGGCNMGNLYCIVACVISSLKYSKLVWARHWATRSGYCFEQRLDHMISRGPFWQKWKLFYSKWLSESRVQNIRRVSPYLSEQSCKSLMEVLPGLKVLDADCGAVLILRWTLNFWL